MLEIGRLWYSVELTLDNAEIFREYLHNNDIRFEPSGCYNLVHFECYMTNDERKAANNFIQEVILKEGRDEHHE